MFIQEARLAGSLHHANIVHVFDLDLIEGRYAIAMELVHSKSLREVLDRCRELNVRFGLPRAVHVAEQVARALAYAHRPVAEGGVAGLVHRDVSPAQHPRLLRGRGEAHRLRHRARAGDRQPDRPGHAEGEARLHGAGAGQRRARPTRGPTSSRSASSSGSPAPASASSPATTRWRRCGRSPATTASSPPSFWNENVPPALDAIVLGALERDPARRTATADEIAARLAEVELTLSRTLEERDLRPLMRRLWPGEIPSRPTPTPSPPPGQVRPPPSPAEAATATWPARRPRARPRCSSRWGCSSPWRWGPGGGWARGSRSPAVHDRPGRRAASPRAPGADSPRRPGKGSGSAAPRRWPPGPHGAARRGARARPAHGRDRPAPHAPSRPGARPRRRRRAPASWPPPTRWRGCELPPAVERRGHPLRERPALGRDPARRSRRGLHAARDAARGRDAIA